METRPQTVYFDAVLHPHRSLTPKGFLIMMLAVGIVSFAAGFVFLMMGAWPVFGFFGLDAALIYLAFRLNYRAGRLVERVRLTETDVEIERRHPSGKVERWSLEPAWARADLTATASGMAVRLRSRDARVFVGRFLLEEEQEAFADAFRKALGRRVEALPAAAAAQTS